MIFLFKGAILISASLPDKLNKMIHKQEKNVRNFHLLFLFLLWIPNICNAIDTITTDQSLKEGQTIISSGGNFELGFFNPGNSSRRYIGIWYKNISSRTVVWVANRETPLINASLGILKVANSGQLLLSNPDNIIWSTNSSRFVQNPYAQLLDSGNLILKDADDENPEDFLWQSFDYPTDTLLAGMKLGWNLETGQEFYLTSWKNINDPAPGNFTYHCDPTGYPQHLLKNGPTVVTRGVPWNGLDYSGDPNTQKQPVFSYAQIINKKAVYFSYQLLNSAFSRFVMNHSGAAQSWLLWEDQREGWILHFTRPSDTCAFYGLCGPYGTCKVGNNPVCGCLEGFVPKYPNQWATPTNWSSGCVRRTPLNCQNGDSFLKYSVNKFPETMNSWYNGSMELEECKVLCLKKCSCTGYANPDMRDGGNGCLLWFGPLIDIIEDSEGQDFYIRLASTEFVSPNGSSGRKREIRIIGLSSSSGVLLLGLSLTLYRERKKYLKQKKNGRKIQDGRKDYNDDELMLFDLATITQATNNFSLDNKIGEGGFGPVYKGVLEDGQEIAVKRHSKTSTQGINEFKNEVICITKLQHRNLVKMLGCCIQDEEKMLIYEYMRNRSLDSFIFGLYKKGTDSERSRLLDWPQRFNIINGIARGLVYLHQDSRLRIIHRDLKASNILLDNTMNPKISDFGTARSFLHNEIGARTNRVVGTYGYMSPEYAIRGLFSVKSDVFSFGVTILEIVSGKKNNGFVHSDHHHSLLGHTWNLYKEGRSFELVDENLGNSNCLSEVLRSIHVGLLCVQQYPEDRPNMSAVIMMLGNEGMVLPEAKQPGFFMERYTLDAEASSGNDVTITLLDPR